MTGRQQLIELTAAQTAVLTRVAWGLDFPQISKDLGVTVTEARLRHRGAMQQLGADNAAHAVALAIGLGLLPTDVATNPQPGGPHVR